MVKVNFSDFLLTFPGLRFSSFFDFLSHLKVVTSKIFAAPWHKMTIIYLEVFIGLLINTGDSTITWLACWDFWLSTLFSGTDRKNSQFIWVSAHSQFLPAPSEDIFLLLSDWGRGYKLPTSTITHFTCWCLKKPKSLANKANNGIIIPLFSLVVYYLILLLY